MEKLRKKGQLKRDDNGALYILNEAGQRVNADEAVIAIWNSCDGSMTPKQMIDTLAKQSGNPREEIEQALTDVFATLREHDLLQV